MKTVKVGVLGAGGIGPSHCAGVRNHPRAELVAVADSHRGRAEGLAKQFQIPRVYTRIEDLIADPDIDAIGVALPTFLHAPAAIAALKAGKHVLLDKPFVMNQGEALKVIEAAKKSRRICTVGMNQRFHPHAQIVRVLARRGDLGDIYHGKAYWCRRMGSPKFGTWFCEKKSSGGGSLLDIGVHALDLCLSLMNNFKPVCVSGVTYSKLGPRGIGEGGWGKSDVEKKPFDVDDMAGALIKLRGGASVILEASWIRHQAEPERLNVELYGTEGGAQVYPAKAFKLNAKTGEYAVVDGHRDPLPYPHCDRMVNWIDAIVGAAKIECTLDQSLAVQKIIDAIYQSSKTGREVRISNGRKAG